MRDGDKAEEDLASQVAVLKQRVAELEAAEAERQRVEEALAQERDLLQTLMDSSPDYIFFKDTESRIIRTNKAHAQLLGLEDPDQAIGKTDFDFFPPEYAQQFYDEEQRIIKTGQRIVSREWKIPSSNGSMKWVSEHKIPLREKSGQVVGLLGITRDITGRVWAEEALRESEERYRTLIENQGEGIGIVDLEERFAFANPAAHDIFGVPPGELVGQYLQDFVDADTFDSLQAQTERRRSGKKGIYQIEIERPSGERRNILVTATPRFDSQGQFAGTFAIFRDMTDQMQVQKALWRRTAQLEALREVGLKITAKLELEALLRSIVSRALELLGGTSAGLYLYQAERDVLELDVYVSPGIAPIGDVIHRGEGLTGRVWESGQSLIVDDYPNWEGRLSLPEDYPFTAVVGVPVCWGKSFLGVLDVMAEPPRTFSTPDAELMSLFATQAAIAIQNARLYEQARRDAETKATLLREVNHRVRNNLASIVALLEIERSRGSAEDAATYQAIMDDLINRIQGVATVHHMLSASEWAPLLLSELVEQVIGSTLKALPPEKHVSAQVSPSTVQVAPKQANDLALVLNELTTNSIKYAWSEGQTGRIRVSIDCEEEADSPDMVVLEFRDDGPGYPDEVLRLEGYNVGWRLIQSIVGRGLRGEISLHNDGGAVTIIRFPVAVV